MDWYLIETMSQRERTVKDRIERLMRQGSVEGISAVLVPMQGSQKGDKGAKRNQDQVAYPGYVFVQMAMDDDNWNEIRRVLDVKGFVSYDDPENRGPKPAALAEGDMQAYLQPIEPGNVGWSFGIGDTVRITSGPMEDIVGAVANIGPTGKATVEVNVFGRITPVDVEASQLAVV